MSVYCARSRCQTNSGYSITEMMIVMLITGIVFSLGYMLFINYYENYRSSSAKLTLQNESRTAMEVMMKHIPQAKSDTVIITEYDSVAQPPHSLIGFATIDDVNFKFYQNNNKLVMESNNTVRILSTHLRRVVFSFPQSDDYTYIAISLNLEMPAHGSTNTTLQVTADQIRIMN